MPAQPLSSAANYCVYANCDGVLCVGRAFLPWNNSSKKPVSRITTNFPSSRLSSPSSIPLQFFSISLHSSFLSSIPRGTTILILRVLLARRIEKKGKKREEEEEENGRTCRFSSSKKRVVVWNDVESGRAAQGMCTLVSRSG